jgi:phage baseplate assembly protein W
MATNLYNGFSTTTTKGIDTATHDIDTVNADILNMFNTPLRSRVGRASFGSIIPSMAFELGDDITANLISADIDRNILSDPRVELVSKQVSVDLDNHQIVATLLLNYVELSITAWLSVPITLDT